MRIMRNDILCSFVLICAVVLSVQTAHLKDGTSSRNSLADSKPSSFVSSHECLYVPPDLPICDFERMEEAEEDIVNSADPNRVRRSVEDQPSHGERHVIVYTIEGCLPPRLPFRMPSCLEENSHGKIVEVRKLYPFTVKGLKKPPLVFPEFNFDRWTRMMKRLQNRTSSPGNTEKSRVEVPKLAKNSDVRNSASAKRSIAPKKMISGKGPSKGSSPNDIQPYDKSHGPESPNAKQRTKDLDFRSTPTTEKFGGRWKQFRDSQASSSEHDETPKPKNPKTRKTDSEKRGWNTKKSGFFTKDFSSEKTKARIHTAKMETDQEDYQRVINNENAFDDLPVAVDLSSSEDLSASSRSEAEVRRTFDRATRGIHRQLGIPAKSIVKRSRKLRETVNSRGNGLDVHGERNKFFGDYGIGFASGKHGVAKYEDSAWNEDSQQPARSDTVENPTGVSQTDVSRTVPEKSSLEKTSGGKKYGKYRKFSSKRDE